MCHQLRATGDCHAGTVSRKSAGKQQGSRLQGLRSLDLAASNARSPRAGSHDAAKAEPTFSDARSEQTGVDDAQLSGARAGAEDSKLVREVPSGQPTLPTLGLQDTAKDGPAVSEAMSSVSALAHVSASTATGTDAAATDAISMQDSHRSGGGMDAAVAPPGAVAASPPAHHRFCPPHGAKAICGRRARMEDAYTAVPFLLEVPMPGSGLPLEVCSARYVMFMSSIELFASSDARCHAKPGRMRNTVGQRCMPTLCDRPSGCLLDPAASLAAVSG